MKSWRVTDIPNDACCWKYHVETEDRERIADVRTEEDARLIAAAQELLAACKEALSTVVERSQHEHEYSCICQYLIAPLKAAIAKADGQP